MSTHHRPPPPKPMDLELTIISAKHLKNVNWRNGDLTPYVIFFLEPNNTRVTRSDDSNNTKPVWNERFVLPVPPGPNPTLTLEVFHSNPAVTNTPLVGSVTVNLDDVINGDGDDIRSFDLRRRSGRVQGKIRLKMSVRQRLDVTNYQTAPPHGFYYPNAPATNYGGQYPPYNPSPSVPPSPAASQNSCNYRSGFDPYSGYYPGGYYAPPPPSPQQASHRPGGYGAPSAPAPLSVPAQWPGGYGGTGPTAQVDYAKLPPQPPLPHMPRTVDGYGGGAGGGPGGPSAPLDYAKLPPQPPLPHMPRTVDGYGGGGAGPSAPVDYAQYEQKQKSGKLGLGLGVGGVIGGMSGLSIDEGSRYEEEKVVESELNAREMDDYSDYRRRVDY